MRIGERSPLFTPVETKVLKELMEGKSTKLIARTLGTADNTVNEHLRHIMKKLGVTNRVQIVLLFVRPIGKAPGVGAEAA